MGRSSAPATGSVSVRMEHVSRRFGETVALDGVSFESSAGEIHALLGENGAGKTTLMRILCGVTHADSGDISLAAPATMVHQHFMLVPELTGEENIRLTHGRDVAQRAVELAGSLGEARRVDLRRPVAEMGMGQRQRVEILRALATECGVLVLDEPTSVLSPPEVEDLFDLLRALRESGRTIVFISHKLTEVMSLCDRVSVLRRGRNAGGGAITLFTADGLADMMVGVRERPIPETSSGARRAGEEVLALSGKRWNLRVRSGQVVAIAGVDGNGQRELFLAAGGFDRACPLVVCGRRCRGPAAAARAGLRLIPADRRREGLVPALSVAENLALGNERFPPVSSRGAAMNPLLDRRSLEQRARRLMEAFDVRADSAASPASTLSGGNQQKLILARVLAGSPRAIVAMNPTWGLDVRASADVLERFQRCAEDGTGILLISTDLDEILGLADVVRVIYRGELSDELLPQSAEIGPLMAGLGGARVPGRDGPAPR